MENGKDKKTKEKKEELRKWQSLGGNGEWVQRGVGRWLAGIKKKKKEKRKQNQVKKMGKHRWPVRAEGGGE